MAPSTPSRRRLLATAGAAALGMTASGLLAACGGAAQVAISTTSSAAPAAATSAAPSSASAASSATATSRPGAATSAATSSAPAAAGAAPAAGAGGIEYWQWGAGYVPGFETLAKAYNDQHPNARVAPSNPASQPDYWNKIVTLQAGGSGPDVFLINNTSFKQWARSQGVTDVTAMMNADKNASANLQAMQPAIVDWYHYKGKVLGVPWDYSAGIIAYNLDQYQEAGLTPINDLGKSWDWNKLREYATKLAQRNSGGITRSGIWIRTGTENGWYTFCVANGARFFNKDLDKCTIASPEAIAGLEFVQGLIKDGVAAPLDYQSAVSKANPDPGANFINGATSMDFLGDWYFKYYQNAKNSLKWDAGIFPYSPSSGQTANTANLRGNVLNPVSKKKDSAWAWMTYLMTKEVQDQIPSLFGEIPANQESAAANYLDPVKGGPPEGRKFLKPMLDATVELPASDLIVSTDLSPAYSTIITDVYNLKQTPSDALKAIQDNVDKLLEAGKKK